jgi:hypothetical protein
MCIYTHQVVELTLILFLFFLLMYNYIVINYLVEDGYCEAFNYFGEFNSEMLEDLLQA